MQSTAGLLNLRKPVAQHKALSKAAQLYKIVVQHSRRQTLGSADPAPALLQCTQHLQVHTKVSKINACTYVRFWSSKHTTNIMVSASICLAQCTKQFVRACLAGQKSLCGHQSGHIKQRQDMFTSDDTLSVWAAGSGTTESRCHNSSLGTSRTSRQSL